MPGYKGHLFGGLIAWVIALVTLSAIHVAVGTSYVMTTLLATLVGALFPDIDTASKGHKLLSICIFVATLMCCLQGYYKYGCYLGLLFAIPAMCGHRGVFHKWWVLIGIVAGISVLCMCNTCTPSQVICLHALFFSAGIISHLWLDLGLKRMLRW